MKTYHRVFFVTVVAIFLTLVSMNSLVWAENPNVLYGIKAVSVVVVGLRPEIERDGLLTSTLKTDLELKLRMAGIQVVFEAEQGLFGGGGMERYVYLDIQIVKLPSGAYIYSVDVELRETVTLQRHSASMPSVSLSIKAITFDPPGVLGISPNLSKIRATAKDEMDEFINAYLSVNPK